MNRLVTVLSWSIAVGSASVSAQSLTFTSVGTIPGPADQVKVQGKTAYVVADKTVKIFDISNPAAPKMAGSYTFPEKIWGFNVLGSLVYVADDFFGLGILDVSNPAAPALRGSIKLPGQAKSVVIYGGKALVSDHMSGVDYVDVSNAAKPTSLGSFFLDGYSREVALAGSTAYAVDSPTGFYVFDLTKSGPLEPVGVVQGEQGSAARGVAVSDNSGDGPKLVCVVSGASLQIYNVSNATAPVLAGTYRTTGGRAPHVVVKGKRAYLADGREGLQVVDFSDPSKPTLVGSFKTEGLARDVAISDSAVLVVVGAEGAQEVKILKQTP